MSRQQIAYHLAERRCRQWNALRLPTGASPFVWVRYHPVIDEPAFKIYQTRSEAWPLAHGEAVVMLAGKAGGVSLDALEIASPMEAAEASTEAP